MLNKNAVLSIGLALMLGACSTVDGVLADFDYMLTGPKAGKAETVELSPMTVEEAMGAPVTAIPVTPMTYDQIAGAVSSPDVELFSLDDPGQPLLQSGGRIVAGTGTFGLSGVPSSTDPSVTVFPFSEDMYTPGVKAGLYRGVHPANARPMMPMDSENIDVLPMYTGSPNKIYFEHSSAALSATAREVIASAARNFDGTITVEGHASHRAQVKDPKEKIRVNYRMSMKRAMAVTKALIAQGVPAEMIKTTAKGDTQPVAEEVDREAEALNRRVEIMSRP